METLSLIHTIAEIKTTLIEIYYNKNYTADKTLFSAASRNLSTAVNLLNTMCINELDKRHIDIIIEECISYKREISKIINKTADSDLMAFMLAK